MRIALLAMTEPAGAGQPFSRAFLRVAGASLAQHQLGLALALDCQRVVCFARVASAELLALQHEAENAGLQFQIVTSPSQLAGTITAADDVMVISEGLFVEPRDAVELLDDRSEVVLVQPVEGALAAGFERIDINRATAGLMHLPGRLLDRLHELPTDCDVPSALTRIALQSGVPMEEVPAMARTGSGWRMIRSEAEAISLENEWLRSRFGDGAAATPGRSLARIGAVGFGSSLLHAGNASNVLSIAVVTCLALAVGMGWFGICWGGFVLAAIAWVVAEASRLLRAAERHALGQEAPPIPRADVLVWLVDAAIGILVLLGVPRLGGQELISWLVLPATLSAVLVLVPRITDAPPVRWASDRSVLGIVLAAAAAVGQLGVVVQLITLGLVLAAIALPSRSKS